MNSEFLLNHQHFKQPAFHGTYRSLFLRGSFKILTFNVISRCCHENRSGFFRFVTRGRFTSVVVGKDVGFVRTTTTIFHIVTVIWHWLWIHIVVNRHMFTVIVMI